MRIGNGAADQLQLDIYGELIDSVYLYNKYGTPIYHDAWEDLARIVEWVCDNWDQADEGIWETRGGRQRLHLLAADVLGGGRARDPDRPPARPARRPRRAGRRRATQIYQPDHGARLARGARRVRPALRHRRARRVGAADAAGRSSSRRPTRAGCRRSTRSSSELVSDSLVYRYNAEASPDGLDGEEGTFSICTFWYVEALARAGRLDEARLAFEKMLTYANHLGLYAEEIGPTGEQLGNFPQAFTHLALISAAVNLDRKLGSPRPARARASRPCPCRGECDPLPVAARDARRAGRGAQRGGRRRAVPRSATRAIRSSRSSRARWRSSTPPGTRSSGTGRRASSAR